MDLQGKLDCKYHVGFFFSDKPQRSTLKEAWPRSPEENLVRLKDAGIPVERGIPKCSNCDGMKKIHICATNEANRVCRAWTHFQELSSREVGARDHRSQMRQL